MARKSSRSYFTLLEVLLVIALVTTVAGAVGINMIRAIREQRFRSEVAAVVNILRLAQQMMLILNIDVDVVFTTAPDGKSILYSMEFEDQFSKGWQKEIKRPRAPLKAIQYLDFQDASEKPVRIKGKQVIRFFSRGTVMSQGILHLANAENPKDAGAFESFICLPGFPYFIRSQQYRDEACNFKKQKGYNQQLTQYTTAEVRDKMRQYTDDKK